MLVDVALEKAARKLATECGATEIAHLREHESFIGEGSHHHGMSALVDLVARKP